MERLSHWIDGKAVDGASEGVGPVFDPATGEQRREVPLGGAAEVEAAVAAAVGAFPGWAGTSLTRRTGILFAFRELLSRRKLELARLITAEHGKVLADALGEVERGLEVVEFACGIPHLLKGSFSEDVSTGVDAYSLRQPLGVMVGITPFNFPAMVPCWMFPIAIACGNTFVLKPSEKDPSASMLLASLWEEAGLPAGVFNVLHGSRVAVEALLVHPDVAAVSFVGSTPVARAVYARATSAGKRTQALGGAKNHMVVLPDADPGAAAAAAVNAGYGSAGERCMAISAVVAVGGVGDALVDEVADRARALRVGPGEDPASEMGPLVTGAHRDRVAGFLDAASAEGASVVVDGRRDLPAGGGFWLRPSLLDRVRPGMSVYDEEIFGPVLSVVRTADLDEAIALVNANPYGNGTAIFTSSGAAARRFQHEVQVGMIGINVPIPVPMAYYSFGGWKQSLFGDTHVHGMEGVHFATRAKAVTARWTGASVGGGSLAFPTNG
jgi:malonate-semialdehyde dehydrogenase (acetylating)/methylmalonate-semialdehyde dehydrogenase